MRARAAGTMLVGVAIGIGLTTALWMNAAGVRIDEEGTALTTFELWIGWGGLAFAVLLLIPAIILRERNRSPIGGRPPDRTSEVV